MPYIAPPMRKFLDFKITDRSPNGEVEEEPFISFHPPETPGELNYILSKIIHEYMDRMDTGYTLYNEVVGVLECAKLELWSSHVSVYERQKKYENGDLEE